MLKRFLQKSGTGKKKLSTNENEQMTNKDDLFNNLYDISDVNDMRNNYDDSNKDIQETIPKTAPVEVTSFLDTYNSPTSIHMNGSGLSSIRVSESPYLVTDNNHTEISRNDALEFLPVSTEPHESCGSGKYKVYGLQNFGNTCYCNSVLQCLHNLNGFRHSILDFQEYSDNEKIDQSSLIETPLVNEDIPSIGINENQIYDLNKEYTCRSNNLTIPSNELFRNKRNLRISSPLSPMLNISCTEFQLDEFSVGRSRSTTLSVSNQKGNGDGESQSSIEPEQIIVGRDIRDNEAFDNTSNTINNNAQVSLLEVSVSVSIDTNTGISNLHPENEFTSLEARKRSALVSGPILKLDYNLKDDKISLLSSIKDIFKAINDNQTLTGLVSPSGFIDVLKRDNLLFDTDMHQDAHELFNFILNDLSESIEKENTENDTNYNNFVNYLFRGTLTNQIRCLTCDTVTSRDESFLDFPIEIVDDETVDIQKLLKSYHQYEMLCGSNKFYCNACAELQEAERLLGLKELPRTLAIHLKRFKYSEKYNTNVKLFNKISYPVNLKVSSTFNSSVSKNYSLNSAVIHIGSGPQHGHYVSICKSEAYGWLLFDDETVQSIKEETVLSFIGDSESLSTAYVLFYKEENLQNSSDLNMTNQHNNIKKLIESDDIIRSELTSDRNLNDIDNNLEDTSIDSIAKTTAGSKTFKKTPKKKQKLFSFRRN